MVFSIYYLARKLEALLHRAHDWIVYFAVGLILWSSLDLGTGLKHALSHLEPETIAGIALIVFSVVLRFTMQYCLRRWNSAALSPADAIKTTSTVLVLRTVASQTDLEDLAEFASSVFPQGPFSNRDRRLKLTSYMRWHLIVPNFAKLITTPGGKPTVVGFSIILPLNEAAYVRYRTSDSEPWDWDHNSIDASKAGEAAYLYFQAIYCYPTYGKGEAGYLTHIVVEHIKELAQGRKPVIIAPRKSASGQANLRRLGFEGVRDSLMGFPLFELDTRRLAELNAAAIGFGHQLGVTAGNAPKPAAGGSVYVTPA